MNHLYEIIPTSDKELRKQRKPQVRKEATDGELKA